MILRNRFNNYIVTIACQLFTLGSRGKYVGKAIFWYIFFIKCISLWHFWHVVLTKHCGRFKKYHGQLFKKYRSLFRKYCDLFRMFCYFLDNNIFWPYIKNSFIREIILYIYSFQVRFLSEFKIYGDRISVQERKDMLYLGTQKHLFRFFFEQ